MTDSPELYDANGKVICKPPEWLNDMPPGQINIGGHWFVIEQVLTDGIALRYVGESRKNARRKQRSRTQHNWSSSKR